MRFWEAVELYLELARLGVELQAHGERIRYRPQGAVTPALLARIEANRGELPPSPELAAGPA